MVSACAILVGGLSGRATAINDRLRALNKERLDLVRGFNNLPLSGERLREIDFQFPDLRQRLKIAHNAVLVIYCAILIFVFDMLLIALAALTASVWTAILALALFLIATLTLGSAAWLTIREVRISLRSILFEVDQVSRLMIDMKSENMGIQK